MTLIYGGQSTEHEISCRSAAFVAKNLDRQRYRVEAIAIDHSGQWWPQPACTLETDSNQSLSIAQRPGGDGVAPEIQQLLGFLSACDQGQPGVVFPVVHGTFGEDGCLQGILQSANIPYVGSDVLGSAIAMDKVVSKRLAQSAGIDVVPWIDFHNNAYRDNPTSIINDVATALTYPVFVKPVSLGSSVGISKVASPAELGSAIEDALAVDERVMVESGLSIREIEFAVLGGQQPRISGPGEVRCDQGFYDYHEKYHNDSQAHISIPANITEQQFQRGRQLSAKVFTALHLYGMARIDWFLDEKSDRFYFNEANAIPGMTSISQYPLLWKHSGLTAAALLDELIDLAQQRHQLRRKLKRCI